MALKSRVKFIILKLGIFFGKQPGSNVEPGCLHVWASYATMKQKSGGVLWKTVRTEKEGIFDELRSDEKGKRTGCMVAGKRRLPVFRPNPSDCNRSGFV